MGTISSTMRQAVKSLLRGTPRIYRECKQCGQELDLDESVCRDCGSEEIAEYNF